MQRHFSRVVHYWWLPTIAFAAMLVSDMDQAIDHADNNIRTIISNAGFQNPPDHLATFIWTHPWAALLVLALVFVVGATISWGVETVWAKLRGKPNLEPPNRSTAQPPLPASTSPRGVEAWARNFLREQRLDQLELAHRLETTDAQDRERKRKLIDDCRAMIAAYKGGHGTASQREAMYGNSGFLALEPHLPDYFLDRLHKPGLGIIDSRTPQIPAMMNALNSHLSRLEKEWELT